MDISVMVAMAVADCNAYKTLCNALDKGLGLIIYPLFQWLGMYCMYCVLRYATFGLSKSGRVRFDKCLKNNHKRKCVSLAPIVLCCIQQHALGWAIEGNAMRRLMKKLESLFVAVTFAEAGEFETARQLLRKDADHSGRFSRSKPRRFRSRKR